jgi:conjugative transfer signal peptidase TraF
MEEAANPELEQTARTPVRTFRFAGRAKRQSIALVVVCIGAAIVAAVITAGLAGGLRINLTPSYALGVWRIVPLDREPVAGDLVFLCPPRTAAFALALERGYMRRGLCPGWITPLIKTVAALPGQHIAVGVMVSIDGRPVPHSTVRGLDAEGRSLRAWPGGVVPPGHLILHSDFRGSYDSRYFGPVPADGLLGRAAPVLTFGP